MISMNSNWWQVLGRTTAAGALVLGLALPMAGNALADEMADEALADTDDDFADDASGEPAPPETAGADEAGARTDAARPLPRSGALTPRGREEVRQFEAALGTYVDEFEDVRATVRRIVRAEFARQQAMVQERFRPQIEEARAEELERRVETIAQFEQFARRYPNHPEYTPDVLFRLAQLLFEQAQYDFFEADSRFREEERRFELGLIAERPPLPEKDLTRTIRTLRRLLRDFPDYRHADSAMYSLAISYDDMDEVDFARDTLAALIDQHPESPYVPEAWLRIGEYYFDEFQFPSARDAYTRALEAGPGRFQDLLLFKRGWANYLLNQYGTALEDFRQLLILYGETDDVETASLLEEALQYFAVVLAERDWNLDGRQDDDFLIPRLESYLGNDEGYELQVIESMVRIFEELEPREEYLDLSADVLGFAIDRFFLDPDTPRRHERIFQIRFVLGDEDEAVRVLQELAVRYGPGTEWFAEQERNGEIGAMAFAERLGRIAMLDSATFAFRRGDGLMEQFEETGVAQFETDALAQFATAAALYGEFLAAYPNDEMVYEARYFQARALFEAREFRDAATGFRWVRDSRLSAERQGEAATNLIRSITELMREEAMAGRLDPSLVPGAERSGRMPPLEDGELPEPLPFPPLVEELLEAYDTYLALDIEDEDEPELQGQVALAAARLLLDFEHVRAARQRLVRMFDRYCGEPAAGFAALLLVQSYERVGDYRHMEYWANQVEQRSDCIALPGEEAERFAEIIDIFRRSAAFNNAVRLRQEGRFEAAALEFARIAEQYPDSEDGPEALYLAGDIYETDLRRYDAAMAKFQALYERYPESEFVDAALHSLALNAQQFFDFDKAIDTFRILHRRGYTFGDNPEEAEHPIRLAAELLEFQQQHEAAARAYLEFVDARPRDDRAPHALYRAGVNLMRAGQGREGVRLLERFMREHGDRRVRVDGFDTNEAVLDALAEIAQWHGSRNDSRAQRQVEDQILREFTARQPWETLSPSREIAARIALERAEEQAAEWRRPQRFANSLQAIAAVIQSRQEGIPALLQAFQDVESNFRDPGATMCARLAQGVVQQEMSDFLFALPMPREYEGDFDLEDAHLEMLETIARAFEDQAILAWTELYNLIEEAGVVNECTIDATRRLNRLRGDDFALYKERATPRSRQFRVPGMVEVPRVVPASELVIDGRTNAGHLQPTPEAESTSGDEGTEDGDGWIEEVTQ